MGRIPRQPSGQNGADNARSPRIALYTRTASATRARCEAVIRSRCPDRWIRPRSAPHSASYYAPNIDKITVAPAVLR